MKGEFSGARDIGCRDQRKFRGGVGTTTSLSSGPPAVASLWRGRQGRCSSSATRHRDVDRGPEAIAEWASAWEKAWAAEQERGIDRDQGQGRGPGSAWDELKRARLGERPQENEPAPVPESELKQGREP